MALDESIIASVANANFKAAAEVPTLLSNVLSQDILVAQRNAVTNGVQTASDARNQSSTAFGVLQKRTAEYDAAEASAAFAGTAHTQRMAVASAAGADSAQVAQSIAQLAAVTQNMQAQMAQLVQLLVNQKSA